MKQWTDKELDTLGAAGELEISSRRADGTLSPPVPIWAVRYDDDVYVRSVNGPSATWYRAAKRRGIGWIASEGIERDVSFLDSESNAEDTIDSAYRDKYGAATSATQRITAPLARGTAIRLTPGHHD